jgi:hypothetical protein
MLYGRQRVATQSFEGSRAVVTEIWSKKEKSHLLVTCDRPSLCAITSSQLGVTYCRMSEYKVDGTKIHTYGCRKGVRDEGGGGASEPLTFRKQDTRRSSGKGSIPSSSTTETEVVYIN